MPSRLNVVVRTGHPDFLDLPWELPLERWEHPRIVSVVTGIHRHVVRFVEYDEGLYALKELPGGLAAHEYDTLLWMAGQSLPAVEAAGAAYGRHTPAGEALEDVVITAHLSFSLPYRALFSGQHIPDLHTKMLEAFAQLLVRLHLAGFFWGDCSLSNTLFRRDAGLLSAYLVDTETAVVRPQLSDGQREHDLMIAEENILGESMDLAVGGRLPAEIDPVETVLRLRAMYDALWDEINRDEVIPAGERHRIQERLRRLNDLGYDVDQLHLVAEDDGFRVVLDPHVVEPGHHRRRLLHLTGLAAQENQARRMLNDIAVHRSILEARSGRSMSEPVAAYCWFAEVYEPVLDLVPDELRGRLDGNEIYHQVQEHRWYLCERTGRDVGLAEAVASYAREVLADVPAEGRVLAASDSTMTMVRLAVERDPRLR